jgi:hypothetical protein
MPLALDDGQFTQLLHFAQQIPDTLRGEFLEHVARTLRPVDGSVGDGDLHRALAAARKATMQPLAAEPDWSPAA